MATCFDDLRGTITLAGLVFPAFAFGQPLSCTTDNLLARKQLDDDASVAYDGETIRFSQSKTGVRMTMPVGQPLKVALDTRREESKSAVTILTTANGRSWTADGFRSSWGKGCQVAGIIDLTFHDLRGTAVTRLAGRGAH